LDYLLKPFIDERFEATMARVKARLNERGLGEFGQRMIHMASKIGKRIDFLNAQSGVPCTAEETENRFSVFTGQVPSKWRPHLPLSCRVRFRLIYPGVDLIYYGNGPHLEYDGDQPFQAMTGGVTTTSNVFITSAVIN
jgi:hypothetical protein